MDTPFRISGYAENETEGQDFVIDFDPSDPDCMLMINWRQPAPEWQRRQAKRHSSGRGEFDVEGLSRDSAGHCVRGWSGLTPRAIQSLRIFILTDEGVERMERDLRKAHGIPDGQEPEIPFATVTLLDLVARSTTFDDRIREYANSLEKVAVARESARKKLSASTSRTGALAAV